MTGSGRPLTITEAAAALGISAEGVRSRLRRGVLAGERHGRTWYVLLTGPAGQAVAADRSATPEPVQGESALLAELRAEVARLWAALEREQAAHGELRRMWHTEQQARQLPPPTQDAATPHESVAAAPAAAEPSATSPRRWWRLWGR